MTSAFVVLNSAATKVNPGVLRAALREYLGGAHWTYEVHEIARGESVADTVRRLLGRSPDALIAAGGDGTVSGAVAGIVGTGTPLGILPLGTGNALAREVGIPLELESALALLVGPHSTRAVDAMRVDDRFFVLAVGAGVSAWVMRDTRQDAKRRFGRASYLWTGLQRLLGLELAQFELIVDGRTIRARASEVQVANAGIAGDALLRWGSHVRVDDGQLDVCVVRARTLLDFVRLVWGALLGRQSCDPNLRFLTAQRDVILRSRPALLVQADGDYIGQTPVHVWLSPAAVRLIVPLTA